MIDIAYITCPRELPTLSLSVRSLRNAGYKDHLHIFAEPGSFACDISNATIHVNNERLGAMRNFDQALNNLLIHGKNDFIAVIQDDMIFRSDLMLFIAELKTRTLDFGYYSLFTNKYMPNIAELCPIQNGWNQINIGWHTWGGKLILSRETAWEIISNDFYQNHLANSDKQIDACISEVCKLLGLPMYLHNPSLSYTIGYTSTLQHGYETDGLNFRQDYD